MIPVNPDAAAINELAAKVHVANRKWWESLDIAAGMKLDLGGAYVEKMAFNAHRADHTREARLAEGGKKY